LREKFFQEKFFVSREGAKDAKKKMHENDIAREIVDAAYKVHTALGPGLLESV